MTQKDYRLLAAALRDSEHTFKSGKAMAEAIYNVAVVLYADNPRFKPAVFVAAAAPTWIVGTGQEKHFDNVTRRLYNQEQNDDA